MLREMGVQLWSREPAFVEGESASEDERPAAIVEPAPVARSAAATPMRASSTAVAVPTAATPATIEPADWLVVGEPLDPNDAQQALLLDNLLRAIGVSRTSTSRGDRAAFVDDPAGIDAAIAAAAPRCVIALGRAAANALLGRDEPIGAWRGRTHRRGDVPVVVTFALAFLLRHPAEKAKAWLDLCLAVGASDAPTG